MDIRNTLRLGDRLDIRLGDEQYRTKLVAIESATSFVVIYLGSEPIPQIYGSGSETAVTSYSTYGIDEFMGKIAFRGFKFSGMPALRIECISDVLKTQRRDFFRLTLEMPVKFAMLSSETVTTDMVWMDAITLDFGEGGMLIRSKYGYAVGSEMECRFAIDDQEMSINGIIRRSDFDVTNLGNLEFTMGLQFTTGSNEMKQQIARFVMQHQIRTRNRAKI